MACYNADKSNTGVDHKMPKGDTKDCAIGCAKAGQPLALLTNDGKVYEISGGLAADKNAKLIAHLSHTVDHRRRDGPRQQDDDFLRQREDGLEVGLEIADADAGLA